jgi:hypothetical protein
MGDNKRFTRVCLNGRNANFLHKGSTRKMLQIVEDLQLDVYQMLSP